MKTELDLFTILPEDKIPEKGKILISEPFLPDTFFNRSIVYLADHNPEGSVGFILNKKLDIKVCDAISGFDKWEEFLSMGGPVSPDTLHYLHNLGDRIPKSVWVNESIFWGGDINFIRKLIKDGKILRSGSSLVIQGGLPGSLNVNSRKTHGLLQKSKLILF
jgi:putative transcriptional regulator